MKIHRTIGAAALALLIGIAVPAFAQDQHDQEEKRQDAKPAQHDEKRNQDAKPPKQEEKRQETKPPQQEEKRSQDAKPPQQEEKRNQDARPEQRDQHQPAPQQHEQQPRQPEQNKQQSSGQQANHEQPQRTQQQQHEQQSAWQSHRAQSWQHDHRTWQQRGGYNGYRIADDRFRGVFGSDHGFRISGLPFIVVGGFPRFQFGGYWISVVDPWPESWAMDWYDTDDVYVVYDNGYYMYNRRYPTAGIAITISL
jgi:hypothetical protein